MINPLQNQNFCELHYYEVFWFGRNPCFFKPIDSCEAWNTKHLLK